MRPTTLELELPGDIAAPALARRALDERLDHGFDDEQVGTLLLLVYAIGLGVPFFLAGLAVDRSLGVMRRMRPHMLAIERLSGVLLIVMGVLLFSERLTLITAYLTRVFGNGLAM